MIKIWIVVTELGETASLMNFFSLDPADVTALVVGKRELAEEATCVVSAVKWIDTKETPAENFAKDAAQVLLKAKPAASIGVSSPKTRAVLGMAAAESGASFASNVVRVSDCGDMLCVERSVLDDKLIETLEMPLHSCLLVNPFNLKPQESETAPVFEKIEEISAQSGGFAEYVSVEPVTISGLQTADCVVGVGLGATSGDLFEQSKKLARLMNAELGCTMPVYNELHLLPHDSYIGLTGKKIAPKLYIALGISGTSQHYAGLRNAKKIVCINKDPKALFFNNADYGIVGDLNEVLPLLIAELKK